MRITIALKFLFTETTVISLSTDYQNNKQIKLGQRS